MKIDDVKILANFFDIDISQYQPMIDQNQKVVVQNKKSTGKVDCNYYFGNKSTDNYIFIIFFKVKEIIYYVDGYEVAQNIRDNNIELFKQIRIHHNQSNLMSLIKSGNVKSTDDIVNYVTNDNKNNSFRKISFNYDMLQRFHKSKNNVEAIDDIFINEKKYENGFVRFYYKYVDFSHQGIIHIKYHSQYYVILKCQNKIYMFRSLESLEDINPYKFRICGQINSFDESQTKFLVDEDLFNDFMEKVDLEFVFG